MSQSLSLRVELNQKITDMFEAIKSYYGFETNSDAIRFLITEKYRELRKEKQEEMGRVPIKWEVENPPKQSRNKRQ